MAGLTEVRLRDLPPGQRRELAALTMAGIATTALMLAPLIVNTAERALLPGASFGGSFVAAPALPPSAPISMARRPTLTRRTGRPRVPNPATLAAHPLVPSRIQVTAPVAADAVGPATAGRGAVVRVLVGDGRYRVQPFPRPASMGQ